jgi:flagellar protein FlaI
MPIKKIAPKFRQFHTDDPDLTSPYPEPLASFSGLGGYTEVERYWVNEPYALVVILLNEVTKEHTYRVVEPSLTFFEYEMLERINDDLQDILTLEEFAGVKKGKVLSDKINILCRMYSTPLERSSRQKLFYFLSRDLLGYGKIDALMRDKNIEDISCNGAGIPIFLYHRKYHNIKTGISFEEDKLEHFVSQLAQKSGKQISIGEPLVNSTLPDGSRLQASFGREVTSRGSSFTIRRFYEDPLTPTDLINFGTMSSEIMAFLWLVIENSKSMMFAGGTACGKTSSLNAVSMFIPPAAKVITIEDTRELTLYHENWIAGITREPLSRGGEGEIDMYELVRQSMRQRPEYIIVGEVRGKEAIALFQAMATGHTTYSTMHASNVQEVLHRLESEPINVPRMMLQSLNLVGMQVLTHSDRERVRRLKSLTELLGIDPVSRTFRFNELYRWNPISDKFEKLGESDVLRKIMEQRGWKNMDIKNELDRRELVLNLLVKNGIRDHKSFATVVQSYHIDPEETVRVLKAGCVPEPGEVCQIAEKVAPVAIKLQAEKSNTKI